MDMTDLALTAKERKSEYGPYPTKAGANSEDSGPKYSYGTRISLGPKELEKLGWGVGDFDVGTELRIEATVKVTELSQNASENNSSARVELQITEMGLEEPDESGPLGAVEKGIKAANGEDDSEDDE